ncbi:MULTISPECIES: hypothetical protein, partial [unclassified Microcystis]
IIQEKILIKTAIIKSKFLNHKKQILDIYQVIIFISQYSTQLRLDKQGSSPLLSDHYPAFKPRGGILVQMLTTLSLLPAPCS